MNYWQVQLNNVRLMAFHGVHEEERTTGTEYRIDLSVFFKRAEPVIQLNQSVDYVRLNELVRLGMQKPEPLLETICERISGSIEQEFPFVTKINITIAKISPPVSNFRGELAVSFSKSYE